VAVVVAPVAVDIAGLVLGAFGQAPWLVDKQDIVVV